MGEWGGANESIKDDRQRGLYGKYSVSRVDGKQKGPYFVLAYVTDPHAAVALAAYADSCEADYPKLASDLRAELGRTEPENTLIADGGGGDDDAH